jgi:tRNA1(Val) A37 N6-methylase TrmN6
VLTTSNTLLNGRIQHRQPAEGFRSGLEPVLLAAAVPARPGERVLEAGAGAGAATLCLSHRLGGIHVTAVEIDPALAGLAGENAAANRFSAVEIIAGDITAIRFDTLFDHAMANPPYHPMESTASPHLGRQRAKQGSASLLQGWITALAKTLKRGGSLTLIVASAAAPACLAALEHEDCRCAALYPLWPKRGRPAKLVLLRGIKGSRRPFTLLAGLVLHENDGRFTPEADAVLREGMPLNLS